MARSPRRGRSQARQSDVVRASAPVAKDPVAHKFDEVMVSLGGDDARAQASTRLFGASADGLMHSDDMVDCRASASDSMRSYVSFSDAGARIRCSSSGFGEEPRTRPRLAKEHRLRFGQQLLALCKAFLLGRKRPQGESLSEPTSRWRQCFIRRQEDMDIGQDDNSEEKDAEIKRLQGLLLAESGMRQRAESEVIRLQARLEADQKIVDTAMAQRRMYSKLVVRSLHEKEQLAQQLEGVRA